MAIINSPAVGSAKNKSGNFVYYVRRGKTVARSYQPNVTNPNTPSQQVYRNRYEAMKLIWRELSTIMTNSFLSRGNLATQFNSFIQHNMQYAFDTRITQFRTMSPIFVLNNYSLPLTVAYGNVSEMIAFYSNNALRISATVPNFRLYSDEQYDIHSIVVGIDDNDATVIDHQVTRGQASWIGDGVFHQLPAAPAQEYWLMFVWLRTTNGRLVSISNRITDIRS